MRTPIDREEMERLAAELMRVVVRYYQTKQLSRDNVYHALNALACTAAFVIAGVGDGGEREAEWFFNLALHDQLVETRDGADVG